MFQKKSFLKIKISLCGLTLELCIIALLKLFL